MKVLFLAPHLSTGGMPAFLLKRIQALQQYTDIEIFVFEWKQYATSYVVQRDQIQDILGKDHFYSCGGVWDDHANVEKNQKTLIDFCYKNKIDIIHIEEIPENFDHFNPFNLEFQKELYDIKHPWRIIETPHSMGFIPLSSKKIHPDGYACVTESHAYSTYNFNINKSCLISFPIDPSIQSNISRDSILEDMGYRTKGEFHIINIGLWTEGKNQKYAIEIAKQLWEKYKWSYIFHFIGNQADNFKKYWEPIMSDLPPNVVVHGERNDTDKFLKIADAMLFTSTYECNPLVLKEGISNELKVLAFNLGHYGEEYIPFINQLSGNLYNDSNLVINTLHSPNKYVLGDYSKSVEEFANKHILFYKLLLDDEASRGSYN